MSQINTFTADVKDSDGWPFKNAFVAVYDDEKVSHEKRTATEAGGQYTTNLQVASLEYYANFWPSKEAYEAKLPSKPLINLYAEGDNRLFRVDLGNEESKQIIKGGMDTEAKTNALEEYDVKRNFA